MNRQQRRKAARTEGTAKKLARQMVQENARDIVKQAAKQELNRSREEAFNDAMNQAMLLTLVLPLKVLMDIYWPKSYKKRLPKFTEHLLEYYSRWENGEWEIDDLKQELWEVAGIKIIEEGGETNV